jgi:hypothetical protein
LELLNHFTFPVAIPLDLLSTLPGTACGLNSYNPVQAEKAVLTSYRHPHQESRISQESNLTSRSPVPLMTRHQYHRHGH